MVIGQNGLLPRGKLSHLSPRAARAWGLRLTAHLHGRIKPTSLSLTRIVSGFFVRPAVRVGGVTLRRETSCARRSSLFCVVLAAPSVAYAQASAQASITGVVRDSSGAVLPGVTVEASSPALIEKVRSAVTDGTGQYRIVDLPAGDYTVTFTLTGFTTVRREGIELSGAFTATVSVELRVGALEETITVTGESPIVDVQSARRQQVRRSRHDHRHSDARVPITASSPSCRASPTSTNDVGGLGGPATVTFTIHGGRGNEGRLQVDGMGVGSTLNGGGVSYYSVDIGNAQEIAFTTSGGLGEAEVGGPVMSIVPRTGGNTDPRHLLRELGDRRRCRATTSRRNCATPASGCRIS